MVHRIEFTKRDVKYIVAEYRKGYGMTPIAKEFGVTFPPVRRVLVAAGVKIRKRGRVAVA